MPKSKLIKFIPTSVIRGIFKDVTIAKSDKEVIVRAQPAEIAKLLLNDIEVKEVSHDQTIEKEITWENLREESTMPVVPQSVSYADSGFTSVLTDYKYPEFKLSALFSNVDVSKTVVRKITVEGQPAGTKMLINGTEVELEEGGVYNYTSTKYGTTEILECKLLNKLSVGETLKVTQSSTIDSFKVGGDDTISATVKKCSADFKGTELINRDDYIICKFRVNLDNVYGSIAINAKTLVNDVPLKGVKYDDMFGVTDYTDEDGEILPRNSYVQGPTVLNGEAFIILPKGTSGKLKIVFGCELCNETTEIEVLNNTVELDIKSPEIIVDINGEDVNTIDSIMQLVIKSSFSNMPIGFVRRKLRAKIGDKSTNIILLDGAMNVLGKGSEIELPNLYMYAKERNVVEKLGVVFHELGEYTFEYETIIDGIKTVQKVVPNIKIEAPYIDLSESTLSADSTVVNKPVSLTTVSKIKNVAGTVLQTVRVLVDKKPYEGVVDINGTYVYLSNINHEKIIFNGREIAEFVSKEGKKDVITVLPDKPGTYEIEMYESVITSYSNITKATVSKTFVAVGETVAPGEELPEDSDIETDDVELLLGTKPEPDIEELTEEETAEKEETNDEAVEKNEVDVDELKIATMSLDVEEPVNNRKENKSKQPVQKEQQKQKKSKSKNK